jgi:hypothetical protein
MNLTHFLQQADEFMDRCTREQLCEILHDVCRALPEKNREDFLRQLRKRCENPEDKSSQEQTNGEDLQEQYQQLRSELKKIDSQEVVIVGVLNEEYDEWYDEGEEFYYEDPEDIALTLAEACDFVHSSMDQEQYKEGFEIGRQLFSMEILCESDYGNDDFRIGDMIHHELLFCNINQVALDTLCCAYHAVSLTERPNVLLELMKNVNSDNITLETMMQYGDDELPDFFEFLPCWIDYLGKQTGHHADRLFLEAVGLLNDFPKMCEYAQRYVATHPGMYLDILDRKLNVDEKQKISIGMHALAVIPPKYIMRSKVALKTAEYITQAKSDLSLLKQCYFAAYESDTTPYHYLQALLHGYETEEGREKLRNVLLRTPKTETGKSYRLYGEELLYGEREENQPQDVEILIIKFLDGQFEEVLNNGFRISAALGWSGTFMKPGIALYLLEMQEGSWSGEGMRAMERMVKSAMGYPKDSDASLDSDSFEKMFAQWKSIVQMDTATRDKAIKKISGLLEKRTEGIMNANRRNYYGECAAFIAALGEAMESGGDRNAKQRLMTSYKMKYSRRSAFRTELKAYGWRDVK